MRFIVFWALTFLTSLYASAQEERSFWDHGLGKLLKGADDMINRLQEEGVDTNYIRKPKLSRMVYLGYYGYFQQHDMTFPVSVDDTDIPLDKRYMPSNMSEKKYMMANMHTYQSEAELGIDWRGISIELPIPIRNRYSKSFGLAKNGSVWGARIRYKSLKNMEGVLDDSFNQAMTQWAHNVENQTNDPAVTEESTIPSGKMDLKIFYVEGYYVFNNKKIAQLTEEDLQKKYVQTIINAGNEVNEALADCMTAREKHGYYQRQVEVLREAYAGTHELMDNGKASYLEVLTAQESLLNAQLSQAMNMYEAAEAVIALYIALGGGSE